MKFTADITYSETTPESREIGDFSDAGHVGTDIEFDSLQELVDYMYRWGFSFPSSYPVEKHTWFSTQWYTKDYGTGTNRQESIHINAPVDIKRTIKNMLNAKCQTIAS